MHYYLKTGVINNPYKTQTISSGYYVEIEKTKHICLKRQK
jgi:hypothetical protein